MEIKGQVSFPKNADPSILIGKPFLDENGKKIGEVTDASIGPYHEVKVDGVVYQQFSYVIITVAFDEGCELKWFGKLVESVEARIVKSSREAGLEKESE